jgi:hypothetical protein
MDGDAQGRLTIVCLTFIGSVEIVEPPLIAGNPSPIHRPSFPTAGDRS